MRRRVVLRSVQRLLPERDVWFAAVLWQLHPRVLAIVGVPAAATVLVALAAGAVWSRALLWALIVAVGAAAISRRYRILASTDQGLALFESSALRQIARSLNAELPDDVDVRKLGGNLITSEWVIDGEEYTVTKRGEKELEQMMAHHRDR